MTPEKSIRSESRLDNLENPSQIKRQIFVNRNKGASEMYVRQGVWAMISAALVFAAASGCKDENKSSGHSNPEDTDTSDTDTTATAEDASWTVLVYMLGDNNLEPYSLMDLAEMTEAGQSDKVNIIVQLDRAKGYTDVWDDWTSVKRFRVVKDDVEELDDLGEENMGAPAVLTDFLDWGLNAYPADHTALILWDHGAGWIGYGGDESADQDMLTYQELSKGIKDGLSQSEVEKFDLLGFDACLMAAYEVAVNLQPFADYLVASEQLEPGHGWDYTSLSALIDDPTIDAKTLGKALLTGFADQAAEEGTDKDITLSLIDLAKLQAVTDAVDGLSQKLVTNMSRDAAVLARSLSTDLEFGANEDKGQALNLFDLGGLSENLAAVEPDYADDAAAIIDALDNAVPFMVRGDVTADATGLSIYFPLDPTYYWAAYDEAAADISWHGVIQAFYQAASELPAGSSPVFTNPDKIADATWDDASSSLLLGGQLQDGTYDSVASTQLEFGLFLSDTELVFLGDMPAEMDDTGYVSGAWSTAVFLIGQGTHNEYCYVSWTTEGDYLIAAVPMLYAAPGDTQGTAVNWVVVYDSASGNLIEADLYSSTANGAVGVLTPEAGSTLYPLGLYSADQGVTFSWESIAVDPLDGAEPMDLLSEVLPSGTSVIAALIALDFAENGDAVFYTGVL
jgi:hypothetical protein